MQYYKLESFAKSDTSCSVVEQSYEQPSRMTFRTFVLLAIVILQCFAQQEISWSDKMPQCIDNPFANINCDEQKEVIRAVEKPTYIKIKEECDAFPKLAVYMNGINSDCLRKETTFMSPTRIAIHNFAQNEAWFVDPATAHPYGFYPPRGLFIFGYSPEPHTVLTGFGGTEYHVDFQLPIPFHPFNPVWKLNFTDSFQRATYYPIETFGDIPSPRTEMSIVEIGDGDLFLFGGVALGSTGFDSFGDGYHFDYQTSTFTKLFDANDTNPTQPQSRYHAHLWFTVIDGVRWVILSQGVTRTSSGTFELNDEKAYNLDTNQWFNLTSVPALWQVTPNNSTIRHGINYDFMTHDDEHVICTSLGDLEHTSNISTKVSSSY